MRVTSNLIQQSLLQQVQNATNRLFEAQERVTTQKKINRISDDPISSLRVLDLRAGIRKADQYLRNISRVDSLADIYDSSLDKATDLITRAKELLISQTSNATATTQTQEAVAIELISLRKELLDIANIQLDNQYIYAGSNTSTTAFTDINFTNVIGAGNTGGAIFESSLANPVDVQIGDTYQVVFTGPATYDVVNVTDGFTVLSGQPYTSGEDILFDGVRVRISDDTAPPAVGDTFDVTVNPPGVYQGDSAVRKVQIEDGHQENSNLTGDVVFQGNGIPGGEDIFQLFDDTINALRSNDVNTLDGALDRFDNALDQVINQRSVIGSRQNLFESTQTRLENAKVGFQSLMSELEDVDIAEAVSDFSQAQTAYESSLSSMSQIIQTSLLDFLR